MTTCEVCGKPGILKFAGKSYCKRHYLEAVKASDGDLYVEEVEPGSSRKEP
jgi:hypothetical protein